VRSILVIGAGMGGLAAAARLARRGFDVTVVEQRSRPGGRCDVLECDGFRFDTGPTLLLMPAVFEETFADLGERLSDHLDLVRNDPTYRVHFHDGSSLDLTADLVAMRDRLEAMESGAFEGFLRFMASGCRFQKASLQHFLGRNFYSFFDEFNLRTLRLMFRMKALTRHYPHVARHFRDRRLRAAFSFQNMYLGLSPYEAPATYALLQYSELGDGVWFPRGGMYRTIETFAAIAEGLGARFLYDAPVRSIEIEGTRATAVRLESGERLSADIILANADLPYVYASLLPDDGTAAKLARKRYSSSTLMFYWGVRGARHSSLLHHNAFLADHRYRESFDEIFRDLTLPEEPSFYVCAATRSDPSFAPADSDGLMALVPVGHLNEQRPQDWALLRDRAREAVFCGLAKIGVNDLPSRILWEKTLGPDDYRRVFNITKGAAFGLSHNFAQVGYLRPHNRHRRFHNLYFVGASTHPGAGLPIVLLSARLVVERILKEQGVPVRARVIKPCPAAEERA
jgi:phytoene desaturase